MKAGSADAHEISSIKGTSAFKLGPNRPILLLLVLALVYGLRVLFLVGGLSTF